MNDLLSIRDQCTFTAQSNCTEFVAHPLKADFCTKCFKKIFSHASEAVKSDEMVRLGLEFSQKGANAASQIIPPKSYDDSGTYGGLYLGGFKAVLSKKFINEKNIQLIVNTAKGLGMFWPVYQRRCTELEAQKNAITFININWVDSETQTIEIKDILEACMQIHLHRYQKMDSVLIHCAQGKSRSTTLLIAYLMLLNGTTCENTLTFVKTKRGMAAPNAGFMEQLKDMEPELLKRHANNFLSLSIE
eukprot:g2307.t1